MQAIRPSPRAHHGGPCLAVTLVCAEEDGAPLVHSDVLEPATRARLLRGRGRLRGHRDYPRKVRTKGPRGTGRYGGR